MRFEFRVLGTTEVVRDGELVRFRGVRERALLGLLVIEANRTVAAERLVRDLWGGDPPAGAIGALRVYVSRVRRACGDDLLVTRAAGYLLPAEPAAVDATCFEALLRDGREQAAAGDFQLAAATLRSALALWRGPALADLADPPAEAVRLNEARLLALEERVEADLACGRHGEIAGELDAVTKVHPLRERFWAQRMLALYRTGRQAEALQTYQALRGILVEQLGIEPGPAVARLHDAVLRQDPELDRPAEPSLAPSPTPIRTVPPRRPAPVPGRTPYVGRDSERATLRAAIEAAIDGAGGLFLIGGEPGVGKTRLTEEMVTEAQARGMEAFVGHAYERAGAAPYVAFVEMFEAAVDRASSARAFRELLGDEAPEIAKLLPALRRLCPDIPPPLEVPGGQERRLLFNSVRDVIARSARRRPLLLVLDDLHWADDPSLLLVEHLAQGLAGIPVLVLATYRDNEVDVGGPLAATFEDLRRRGLARWMLLRRLPEQDVGEMIAALAGRRPAADLVRALHARTDGNPFFVEEVYRYLHDAGRLWDAGGQPVSDLGSEDADVPDGIRRVVARRLARLGTEAGRTLSAAAVVGRAFSVELLEAMRYADAEGLLLAIEAAERAQLVAPAPDPSGEDRYVFAHELVRQTLLADLSLTRRRRLHARAADAIEHRCAHNLDRHAAAVVHHLLAAGATDDRARLFRLLARAGRQAINAAAFEDAVAHLDRAIPLAESVATSERAAFFDDLGRARRSTGQWEFAIEAWRESIEAYQQSEDAAALGAVCVHAATSLGWEFRLAEAAEICRQGIAALDGRPTGARAHLLDTLGLVLGYAGDHQGGAALIDEALAISAGVGDDAARGHALVSRCIHRWAWLELSDAVGAGREGVALSQQAGDLFGAATAQAFVALALVHLGRLGEARATIKELEPRAERLGNHLALLMARRVAAMTDFFETGGADRLEVFGRRDLAEVTRQGLSWTSQGWAWQGVAAFVRGDWETALTRFAEAAKRELPGTLHGWDTAMHLECLAYLGHRAESLSLVDAVLAGLPARDAPVGWGGCSAVLSAVEALVVLGESERAAELYDLLAGLAARADAASGNFYDGRLLERGAGIAATAAERWDEAERHFRAALDRALAIPHRPEHAHTCRWYGALMVARGTPDAAGPPLISAADGYARMGMVRHRRLATDLLATT